MPDKHDDKPKPKPEGPGPKERELAISLTVAILNAAQGGPQPIEAVEKSALATYRRVLHEIGPAGPPKPKPPSD